MKLPAIEPYSQCQTCKAEMQSLSTVMNFELWWCSKCGTLATTADQWVPRGKWISVEESAPEDNRNVVISDGVVVEVGYFDSQKWWYRLRGSLVKGITHWQELPEGPK